MRHTISTFLIIIIFTLSACGGGGSNGSRKLPANGNEDDVNGAPNLEVNQSLQLLWNLPQARINGDKLTHKDIQGCVILYFSDSELLNYNEMFLGLIPSHREFLVHDRQIDRFISAANLPEIVSTGTPNSLVIYSSDQTSYIFDDIDSDLFHFAVSCFDWDQSFSDPSNTITIDSSDTE